MFSATDILEDFVEAQYRAMYQGKNGRSQGYDADVCISDRAARKRAYAKEFMKWWRKTPAGVAAHKRYLIKNRVKINASKRAWFKTPKAKAMKLRYKERRKALTKARRPYSNAWRKNKYHSNTEYRENELARRRALYKKTIEAKGLLVRGYTR